MNRPFFPNIILIGSTARKAGKTSYVMNYLKKNPGKYIAVKIQTSLNCEKPEIIEEKISGFENDTQKYLSNGATKSYLIKCPSNKIMEAFQDLYNKLDDALEIICESTSLIKFIKPKKFILFRKLSATNEKDDLDLLLSLADEIIEVN